MSEPAVATKVTVRIGPDVRQRLVAEAAAERRPVASMARLLIADALADRDRDSDQASTGRRA